jgi:NitT/TauT family transport system substrate-binding protein
MTAILATKVQAMTSRAIKLTAYLALAALMGWTAVARAAEQIGTVRFVTPGPTITTLPMEVVRVKGFDKAEGFTAAFTAATGSVSVKAMVAGDFDFSLAAGSTMTGAIRGLPLKVIYVHVDKSLYFLYAREGVANLKALEGKRVGIDAIGGTQDLAVREDMRLAGADDKKTTFIAMGYQNIPPSLIAGAIDAGVITPPKEFQLINSSGKFHNLGFLGDLAPGLTGGVATTDKMLHEHPDTVRAVLRAHVKAHKFLLENRDEMIPIMSKFLGLSMKDAAQSYDTTVRPYFSKTGTILVAAQQKFIAQVVKQLKLPRAPAPEKVFDLSYIPK